MEAWRSAQPLAASDTSVCPQWRRHQHGTPICLYYINCKLMYLEMKVYGCAGTITSNSSYLCIHSFIPIETDERNYYADNNTPAERWTMWDWTALFSFALHMHGLIWCIVWKTSGVSRLCSSAHRVKMSVVFLTTAPSSSCWQPSSVYWIFLCWAELPLVKF